MECPNCNSESIEVLVGETIECSHCSEVNVIEYCRCNECGCIFKAVDDTIIEGSVVEGLPMNFMENLEGMIHTSLIDPEEAMDEEEFRDMLRKFGNAVELKEVRLTDDSNMSDLVHKCIQCGSLAYEVKNGYYKCSNPECGFIWEVINCG